MLSSFAALRRLKPRSSHGGLRFYAVVAWGDNSRGQCGVPSHSPALFTPQEVNLPSDATLSRLKAGHNHSAAVTSSGEVYTFGCGLFGKLGIGRSDAHFVPQRVENLVGRAQITDVALGDHFSLFLDQNGSLYACGISSDEYKDSESSENFDSVSIFSRSAFNNSVSTELDDTDAMPDSSHFMTSTSFTGDMASSTHAKNNSNTSMPSGDSFMKKDSNKHNTISFHNNRGLDLTSGSMNFNEAAELSQQRYVPPHVLVPFVDHFTRTNELKDIKQMYDDEFRGLLSEMNSRRHYEAFSTTGLLGQHDPSMRHFSVPIRLGTSFHSVSLLPTSGSARSFLNGNPVHTLATCSATGSTIILLLHKNRKSATMPHRQIQQLRMPRRWVANHKDLGDRHAALLLPTPLCDPFNRLLEDHGGVVQIAAGAGFFAARTASGRVFMWLDASISSVASSSHENTPTDPREIQENNTRDVKEKYGSVTLRFFANSDTLYIEFDELPAPITHMAANNTSLVLSDGSSVWNVTVHSGMESDSDLPTSTLNHSSSSLSFQPKRILSLKDEGVWEVSAGGTAGGVVTDSGRLWMWGHVMPESKADELLKKINDLESDEGYGHWAYSSTSNGIVQERSSSKTSKTTKQVWWPGLGSTYTHEAGNHERSSSALCYCTPVLVPGLHGVKRLALGGGHALAEVA